MGNSVKPIKKEQEFDIKKASNKFLSQWKFFLITLITVLALAFLFIKYATPLYVVHAQVLIEDNDNNGSSSGSSFTQTNMLADFSGLFSLQNNVYNEVAILKTIDLLEKTIKNLNLNINYYKKEDFKNIEIYKANPFNVDFVPASDSILLTEFTIRFPQYGNAGGYVLSDNDTFKVSANFGDTIKTPVGNISVTKTGEPFNDREYDFAVNSIAATISSIQKDMTISIPDDQTTVIEIDYNTNLPKKGEAVVKQLINEYTERNLNEKNQISDSTIAFINSRIRLVSSDLSGIESDIEHFKQQNNIADIEAQSQLLIQNTSTYSQQLNQADVQLNVIQTMLDYLLDDKNVKRPVPALLTTDPTFTQLMSQYNSLILQRERISLTVKENNPIATNLETQIRNIRNDIVKSLQSQKKAMEISKAKLVQQNAEIAYGIHKVPAQEKQFIDLSREKDIKQALYLYLLQKKEETAITRASNIPNATVIQEPRTEYLPYFPNKILIMSAAILLAMIIPTSVIVLMQLLSNKIISRDDIVNATSIPIISEIGNYTGEGILDIKQAGRSAIAEQFRIFRTNMDFITQQKSTPVILVTSATSGEGKSFVSSGLAAIYGYSGKKVLLMEMDLRKPKISSILGFANEKGFTSYIIGQRPAKDFVKPINSLANVFLFSAGLVPPNPAELLMNDKMAECFDELKKEFDIIIVDTAPIGAVTDAQLLSKFSDANLFVVRQSYSYKNSIEFINELVETGRMEKLYIVVNDVKKHQRYRYGYRYGYNYSYGENLNRKAKKH